MKKKLIDIIKNSGLLEKEKKEWEAIIKISPQGFLSSLAIILLKFPDQLGWLNGIYQKKKEAFRIMKQDRQKARQMFEEIYQKEKEGILNLKRN